MLEQKFSIAVSCFFFFLSCSIQSNQGSAPYKGAGYCDLVTAANCEGTAHLAWFFSPLPSCLCFGGGKTDPGDSSGLSDLSDSVEALKKSAVSEGVMLQGLNEVFLWLCRCEKAEGH